jgi:hypothetical protein
VIRHHFEGILKLHQVFLLGFFKLVFFGQEFVDMGSFGNPFRPVDQLLPVKLQEAVLVILVILFEPHKQRVPQVLGIHVSLLSIPKEKAARKIRRLHQMGILSSLKNGRKKSPALS